RNLTRKIEYAIPIPLPNDGVNQSLRSGFPLAPSEHRKEPGNARRSVFAFCKTHMSLQTEIMETWAEANSAIQVGNFQQGAELYRHIIALLLFLKQSCGQEIPTAIKVNLANACADLAACLLETCGTRVNEAVHALLESINYGNREPKIIQN